MEQNLNENFSCTGNFYFVILLPGEGAYSGPLNLNKGFQIIEKSLHCMRN